MILFQENVVDTEFIPGASVEACFFFLFLNKCIHLLVCLAAAVFLKGKKKKDEQQDKTGRKLGRELFERHD